MDIPAALGFEATHTPQHIILFRLLVAAVLGAVIGYERGARDGNAGLRTHILIATAAALFSLLAMEIYALAGATETTNADPIRIIEAVTAGIAFLGAGAIFRRGGGIRGLTTGAGMWLAGAVGVAASLGYYLIAAAAALLAVLVLGLLRNVSHQREPYGAAFRSRDDEGEN